MKKLAMIAVIAFFAVASARADDPPDYSRAALLRFVHDVVRAPSRHVEQHIGMVAITNGQTQVRIAYLPMLAPLSGSAIGVTQKLPNPFELTNTQIAMSRKAWER